VPADLQTLSYNELGSFSFTYTVPAGTASIVNTASVTYHPGTFTNNISDTDSWTTNLFEPSVDIEKTGTCFPK